MPMIMFRVAPGTTERIPLLIGTASFQPELGYTVPPGSWASKSRSTWSGTHAAVRRG
jgi:hypothetical protein